MTCVIMGLLNYSSFGAMVENYDPKRFGGKTVRDVLASIDKIYSYEDQRKNGVIGIVVMEGQIGLSVKVDRLYAIEFSSLGS